MTETIKEEKISQLVKDRIEQIRQGIVPEGYKETTVGIVPKEWIVNRIKDINDVVSGMTPSRRKEEYYNGSIAWIKTTDLNNSYICKSEEMITEKALKNTSIKLIKKNSILIAMYGGFNQIGRTGLLKIDATTNQAISSIYIDEREFNSAFVLQWLNLNRLRWRKFAASSRKDPNITKGDVENFIILKPNYAEQQKIADILSTWDQAIELKETLIKEKEEQKKGLMRKIFSQIDRTIFVGDLIKESKVIEDSPTVEKLLTVRLHLEGVSKRELRGNETVGATTLYNRSSGQFIYGKQNFHNGALGIVPVELDGFLSSSDIPSFDFDLKQINPLYFYYYWSKESNYKRLAAFTTGTGSKRLNPKEFYKIKMKFPPLNEQNKIANILSTADKQTSLLKQELDLLKEQKKGLMQLLLTGIVRVGEVERLE